MLSQCVQDAFMPPPQTVAEHQAYSRSTDRHEPAAAGDVQPPAEGSSSIKLRQQQQQEQQQALLTQRLDVFGPELAHSVMLQQRPPLQPGKSGNSRYTVAPHQVQPAAGDMFAGFNFVVLLLSRVFAARQASATAWQKPHQVHWSACNLCLNACVV
jgi:hypothetical protein